MEAITKSKLGVVFREKLLEEPVVVVEAAKEVDDWAAAVEDVAAPEDVVAVFEAEEAAAADEEVAAAAEEEVAAAADEEVVAAAADDVVEAAFAEVEDVTAAREVEVVGGGEHVVSFTANNPPLQQLYTVVS